MIEKIIMITCDICREVDYFPTDKVQVVKECIKNSNSSWIFKNGKHFCCVHCYKEFLKQNS